MSDLDTLRANRRREMDRLGRRRRQLAQLAGQPTHLVPAAPIRSRLNALHELGWSFEAIAAMHGSGTNWSLTMIANGQSFKCEQKFAPIADLPVTLHVPDRVGDNMWVPVLGATRRVRSLLALGWRHADISEAIGRSSHSIACATYLRTRAIDWRIVDAAFERMSSGRGASSHTASRAAARGYLPPFAWRDIDNPRERGRATTDTSDHLDPVVVERILSGDWNLTCTPAEKAAACERWAGQDKSLTDLERLTGWNVARYFKKGAAA